MTHDLDVVSRKNWRPVSCDELDACAQALALGADQIPCWRKFAVEAARADQQYRDALAMIVASMKMRRPPLPERMRLRLEINRIRARRLSRLRRASLSLYRVLTSRQQSQADRILARMCPPPEPLGREWEIDSSVGGSWRGAARATTAIMGEYH